MQSLTIRKCNTKSSTEAELVDVTYLIGKALRTKISSEV